MVMVLLSYYIFQGMGRRTDVRSCIRTDGRTDSETRNCKGPQTISAANVGPIKDLISQKNVKTNDRVQG